MGRGEAVEDRSMARFLKGVPIFRDLSSEDLERVAHIVYERRYRKGQIIFAEGEPGEAFFVVKTGRVKVSKLAEDGREQILSIWHPGDPVGMVVLFDGQPYSATAEAADDTTVAMIRVRDFQNLLSGDPRLAGKVLREVGGRLRQAFCRISEMALMDTPTRLASTLLKMAEEDGVPEGAGIRLAVPLTHQELGNLIGASRETVTRILSDFRRARAIAVDKNGIVITDLRKLRTWT